MTLDSTISADTPEELAEKLVLSLTDTALYDKLKGLSYKRAMDFSAEKSVADFMEIIGE